MYADLLDKGEYLYPVQAIYCAIGWMVTEQDLLASHDTGRFVMAAVGLVKFAGYAVAIAKRVIPLKRNIYSKHAVTQPQFLAILCLMRYED